MKKRILNFNEMVLQQYKFRKGETILDIYTLCVDVLEDFWGSKEVYLERKDWRTGYVYMFEKVGTEGVVYKGYKARTSRRSEKITEFLVEKEERILAADVEEIVKIDEICREAYKGSGSRSVYNKVFYEVYLDFAKTFTGNLNYGMKVVNKLEVDLVVDLDEDCNDIVETYMFDCKYGRIKKSSECKDYIWRFDNFRKFEE